MTPSRTSRKNTTANAPFPFPTAESHGAVEAASPLPITEAPTEDALDHGIEESFPASDPVSVSVTKAIPEAVRTDALERSKQAR